MEKLIPDPKLVAFFMVLFGCMYVVLKQWLFLPYLEALDDRDADTTDAADEFEDIEAEIASARTKIDDAVSQARSEANAERDRIVNEASRKANDLVSSSQADARARVEAAREELDKREQEVLGKVETTVGELAENAANRLLKGVR